MSCGEDKSTGLACSLAQEASRDAIKAQGQPITTRQLVVKL